MALNGILAVWTKYHQLPATAQHFESNSIFFSYEKNATQETIGSNYDAEILIGQGTEKEVYLYLTEAQCEWNP